MAGNYKLQISLNNSLPYCYMRIKTKTIFKYVLCLPYKSPSTTDVCYFFSLSKMNSWVTAISSPSSCWCSLRYEDYNFSFFFESNAFQILKQNMRYATADEIRIPKVMVKFKRR